MSIRILIIEDEPGTRRLLSRILESSNMTAEEAACGKSGLMAAARRPPDAVILDLGLPDTDGLEIINELRTWSEVPIVVLSGDGQEDVKVECLRAGADDYVTKPFGAEELLARLEAILRRRRSQETGSPSPVVISGPIMIDSAKHRVEVNGEEIHFTPLEFRLLLELAKHSGRVVTQDHLLTQVWGPEYAEDAQNLRVYIGYLRKKLREKWPTELVLTEPHIGYRLAT